MKNLSLKALIYGLKCTGRGYERRVTDNNMTHNDEYASVMKLSWNDRKEYSSWCKFRFSTRRFNSTNKYVEDSINYLNSNPNNSSYYMDSSIFS